MYIADWDTFAEQAEALYRSDPLRTRYVLKYRHCDGKAVLKVTDDKTASVITDQSNYLTSARMKRGFVTVRIYAGCPVQD